MDGARREDDAELERARVQPCEEARRAGRVFGCRHRVELHVLGDADRANELACEPGRGHAEDARADLAKAEDRATKPVRDKLFQFLQGYAQQRGIVLIINIAGVAQTGSIAFANPATDITEDFIKEYNKANPVPVSAPAAQPATPKKPGQ